MVGFSLTKGNAHNAVIVNYNNTQRVYKAHFDIGEKHHEKLFTVGLLFFSFLVFLSPVSFLLVFYY